MTPISFSESSDSSGPRAQLLPKHEWMRVFDHVFSNDAPFLAYLVLAYLVYFRAALLRVTSVEDLQFFLHHQVCFGSTGAANLPIK